METVLAKIAKVARERPKEKFTSLAHYINGPALYAAHVGQDGMKAVGVDGVTKAEYEKNIHANVTDLVARLKRHAYKPQPVRRAYIRKEGTDKLRPLGIPAYEDKLVQAVLAEILSTIYEETFLDYSYGFRKGRSCLQALKALNHIIERKKVHYIVDADIKGFFDHVDHDWLLTFLKERIADPNILRLIVRFLKAGVMEEGKLQESLSGTPQGGLISPVLGNIYLHYALDLWFYKHVREQSTGACYLIRYADDFVCCFEKREDAERFYEQLIERLAKFKLSVAVEKTKIIRFGRPNGDDENPGTFDFLGFTHFCGKSKSGSFRVKRKTARKKLRKSLLSVKQWLVKSMHTPTKELISTLRSKVRGHYNYYGLTDNRDSLSKFYQEVIKMLKWILGRRSQKSRQTWEDIMKFLRRFPLPYPRIYHSIFYSTT